MANANEPKHVKPERKGGEETSTLSIIKPTPGVSGQKHPREAQTPKMDHKKHRSYSTGEDDTPETKVQAAQNKLSSTMDEFEQRLWHHLAHRQEKILSNLSHLAELFDALASLVLKGKPKELEVAEDDPQRKRVEHAEHASPMNAKRRKSAGLVAPPPPSGALSAVHVKALQLAREAKISDVFAVVPEDYYEWELEARRELLGAPTVHHLVKTIVMTNTKAGHDDISDPLFSKHYMVIVQYTAKLCNESIQKRLRELNVEKKGSSPPKKNWNFRLCDPEEQTKMTGFGHNAVCPLGSATRLPVILSHKIAELGKEAQVWFGGGEVNLKWRIGVDEFINHFQPIVADITY